MRSLILATVLGAALSTSALAQHVPIPDSQKPSISALLRTLPLSNLQPDRDYWKPDQSTLIVRYPDNRVPDGTRTSYQWYHLNRTRWEVEYEGTYFQRSHDKEPVFTGGIWHNRFGKDERVFHLSANHYGYEEGYEQFPLDMWIPFPNDTAPPK